MKLKKTPYYLLMFFLVLGASLTLGFLSFGGMLVFLPALPIAIGAAFILRIAGGAFILSTAYEAEIYFQNIKSALNKLTKRNYLKQEMGSQFLKEHFPDTSHEDCPVFFKDYEKQLRLVDELKREYKKNKELKVKKKQAEKTLKDMEKWFSLQLFPKNKQTDNQTDYARELTDWLRQHGQDAYQKKYTMRYRSFHAIKAVSLISGVFMTLATFLMMADTIAAIPALTLVFASSAVGGPLFIMAATLLIAAGTAWALQTYNTITDIINNDLVRSWYKDLIHHFSQGFTPGNIIRGLTAVLLVLTTIALTAFTAGTWWTIAKEGKTLFGFTMKLPGYMGVINSVVLGLSTGAFNISNSSETLTELTQEDHSHGPKKSLFKKISSAFEKMTENESLLQTLNPFRMLIKLVLTPIRVLLFLGHLASIGVTADRFPGIPTLVTALVGVFAEGFEDFHYFLNMGSSHHHHGDGGEIATQELLKKRHDSKGGHEHGKDIPTQLIKFVFSPLYLLAIGWDWSSSKLQKLQTDETKQLSFADTFKKHGFFLLDFKPVEKAFSKYYSVYAPKASTNPDDEVSDKYNDPEKQASKSWQVEHALHRINSYEEKHLSKALINPSTAAIKKEHLQTLKTSIKADPTHLEDSLSYATKDATYNRHRLFSSDSDKPTRTQSFLEDLPQRIGIPPAA